MAKLIRSTAKCNFRDQLIVLNNDDGEHVVARFEFMDQPFITSGFVEKICNAIMHEIREQMMVHQEGEDYDRNPSFFDKKRAERTAAKIIQEMKDGLDGF